jgi:hypothetical protein
MKKNGSRHVQRGNVKKNLIVYFVLIQSIRRILSNYEGTTAPVIKDVPTCLRELCLNFKKGKAILCYIPSQVQKESKK